MKISNSDHAMAVARHPQFLKDYNEYMGMADDAKERHEHLCRKWREDINKIIHVYCAIDNETWMMETWKSTLRFSVEPVSQVQAEYPPIKYPFKRLMLDQEPEKTLDYQGKRLYLKVDITQSLEKLQADFEKWVRKLKELMPRSDMKRNREGVLSPWRVYDMKTSNQRTFPEIVHLLTTIPIPPERSVDENFRAYVKQADRAYKKACAMIDEVGKLAGELPIFS